VEACSTIFTSCAAKAVELATINPMVAIGTSRRKDGNSFRQFGMEISPGAELKSAAAQKACHSLGLVCHVLGGCSE